MLAQRKFSEIPVVDAKGRPIGLVDVTDVVGLKAEHTGEETTQKSAKSSVRVFPSEGAA